MRSGFRVVASLAVMACLGVVAVIAFVDGLNRWHLIVNCLLSVAILAGASALMLRCLPAIVAAYGMGYRDGMKHAESREVRHLHAVRGTGGGHSG